MGRVYRAVDHALQREVAIKEFAVSRDHLRFDELSERFRNEALIASRLSHPGVATVFDQGHYAERPWYAMQWLRGARTLGDFMDEAEDRGDKPPIEDGMFFLWQMVSVLRLTHELGLWHRDIKPSNILVASLVGGGWNVKLIDWGIAHDPDAKLTDLGASLGTPAYMAPECFDKDYDIFPPRIALVDHRSDLFSLGITFYEYFAGEHPYPQIIDPPPAKRKLPRAHLAAETYRDPNSYPPPLGQRRSGLPDGLEAIIHRLIERQPEERYQSADEVLQDLAAPGDLRRAPYRLPSRSERRRRAQTVAARRQAGSPSRSAGRAVPWLIAAMALGAVALLSFAAGRWLTTPSSPVEVASEPQKAPTALPYTAPEPTPPASQQPPAGSEQPTPVKPPPESSSNNAARKKGRKQRRKPAAEPPPQDDPWPAFLIEPKSDD
jgi:serine/threonine-protein kinase